ncbi:MAG: hypothetical protein WD009_12405 [Phycisphaeraceae bacterium]
MAEHNGENGTSEINVPLILLIGVISGLLLLIIAIGAQGWYYYEATQQRQIKVYEGIHADLVERRATQQERLETLRWVDEENQRAAIPLDEAFARYLEQTQGGQ